MHDLIPEQTLQIANLFLIYTTRLSYRNRITVTFNPQWVWATLLRQGVTRRGGNPSASFSPLSMKLQQIEFRVRQREKAVCTLARESWCDLAQAGFGAIYDWRRTCDRASWKFMPARTAPSDKTYYRRRIACPECCPCFRRTSLLPAYSRPSCLFFSSTFRLHSRPKRVRRLRSIRERGVSLLQWALPRHR